MESVLVYLITQGMNIQTQDELETWAAKCSAYAVQSKDEDLQKSAVELSDILHWKIKSSFSSAVWDVWYKLYHRTGITPERVLDILQGGACDETDKKLALCWAAQEVRRQLPMQVHVPSWAPAKCPRCGSSLSTHHGDGYYTHSTFLERCPECGQVLQWASE